MELLGFEIKRKKKLHPAKPRRYVEPFYMPRDERLHQFSNSEILDALRMISDRLSVVRFTAKTRLIFTDQLIEFIQSHMLELLRRLFYEGYVIIETGTPPPPPDGNVSMYIPPVRFVTQHEGRSPMRVSDTFTMDLSEGQILMLSTCMQSTGHTDAYFLKDKLEFLDTINASDLNLIKNYGALGIISPEADNSVAGNFFDEEDIKTMQENYRRMYAPSRWSMFFAPRPTRFSAIALPIDALKLSEKRLYCLQAIYAALGIPKELSIYFENAKYENRNAAELDFYNSTIRTHANFCLKIIKKLYESERRRRTYLPQNEFWFDFADIPAFAEKRRELVAADIELFHFWQEVATSNPEEGETARIRMKEIIENL